ncbi:MAG: hypothetical protein M3Q50_03005 [Chloroflexota bacterium]|nr:hypothetical protein [Chloroflexota bacterium]
MAKHNDLPHIDGQQDVRPALGQPAARAPAQQPGEPLALGRGEDDQMFGVVGHGGDSFPDDPSRDTSASSPVW